MFRFHLVALQLIGRVQVALQYPSKVVFDPCSSDVPTHFSEPLTCEAEVTLSRPYHLV